MQTIWHDLRQGMRLLARNPGFTAVALVTLALGIGLNSALFSVVNAVLYRPLPVDRPDELVAVYNRADANLGPITHEPLAFPDYRDFKEGSPAIEGMFAYQLLPLVLEADDAGQVVIGEIVTGSYFTTLGVTAAKGRVLQPDDDGPAGGAVAVLTHAAWQRRFGADPGIVGRTLRVNGTVFTVVGVARATFTGLLPGIAPELWVPMGMTPTLRPTDRDRLEHRDSRSFWAMGRLARRATRAQAAAELQAVNARLQQQFPLTNRDREVDLLDASQVKFMPGVDRLLQAVSFVLLAAVGLVLLIACANIAGMLLARGAARRREMAIRLSLGARRGRLARQLLLENVPLGVAAGAAALMLAAWSNAGLSAGLGALRLPIPIPLHLDLGIDGRVLLFTFAVAFVTIVACSLTPALAATRTDLVTGLKEEAVTTTESGGRQRLRSALVIAQVGISLVLLIGAGLSLRSAWNAHRVDPGFDPRGVVTAAMDHTLRRAEPGHAEAIYRQVAERVGALPGVQSVAYSTMLPLALQMRNTRATPSGDSRPEKEWPAIDTCDVGPGYFATMRIPIVRGRAFGDADRERAVAVVVNEALASQFWPGQEAIGQTLRVDGSETPRQVVGVARNSKYRTLGEAPRPYFYGVLPLDQPDPHTLIARVSGDPQAALAAMRREIRRADDGLPLLAVQTLEEAIGVSLLLPRAVAVVFGLFGALGLGLAAVGIYGLVAYVTARRTREIGVRMALGARTSDILRLVIGQGLWLTLFGVAVGIAGALALTRVLGVVLYGISPTDPATFAVVSGALVGVALAACFIPARRAARLHPMRALRHE